MDEIFDPYLKWLGIPAKDRPINYYRLLGVELFETDADAISNAADQRMVHLKGFISGSHAQLSQKLLNEVSAARVCLLNPEKRAKYDAALREQLEKERRRAEAQQSLMQAEPAPTISVNTGEPWSASSLAKSKAKAQRQAWLVPGVVGAAVCVVFLLLGLVLVDRPQTPVAVRNPPAPAPRRRPTKPRRPAPVRQPESQKPDVPDSEPPAIEPPGQPVPQWPVIGPGQPAAPKPASRPTEPANDPTDGTDRPWEPVVEDRAPDAADAEQNVPEADQPASPPPEKPEKLPELDDEAKKKAEKEIREIYKNEFSAKTPRDKLALAADLAENAMSTGNDADTRFVLLQLASNLAAEAGNSDWSLELIDQISQGYDVDALEMKADVLSKVGEKVDKKVVSLPIRVLRDRRIIITARKLYDQALKVSNLEAADRFLEVTLRAARRLKNRKLIATLQSAKKDIERLQTQFALVQQALKRLEKEPDNPKANLAAGSWYCLIAGKWDEGLPWLAKGNDVELADIAKQDMANPSQPEQQAKLGDRWRKLGENKKGIEKSRLQVRAAHWYKKALPGLSGLLRTKVEKRLHQMGVHIGLHALRFDGVRNHVVVRNLAYNGKSPITVEAIVKPAADQWREQGIIGNAEGAGLMLGAYYGRWGFTFHYKPSRFVLRECRLRCQDRLSTENWTHVAGVYDGAQLRLYVDGKLQMSEPIAGVHKPSRLPFVVGADPMAVTPLGEVSVNNHFRGIIKSVRISSAAIYTNDFDPPSQLDAARETTVLVLSFNRGEHSYARDADRKKGVVAEIKDAEWVELDEQGEIVGEEKSTPTLGPNRSTIPAFPIKGLGIRDWGLESSSNP